MKARCCVVFFTVALVLFLRLPAFAEDPRISANTCASPASSTSKADPFTTTFAVTVKPGDTVLSVVDGYRAAGKTVASVVFNGAEALTRSAGTLGNTMGAEIWSLKNPTATTANVVITYTNGGTFVFDYACARTFAGVDLPVQASSTFTTPEASGSMSLAGLASITDKAVFVDVAACNCGGLIMIPEANRTLDLNAGPNQVGSSTIVTKSPAGSDTMPWRVPAVQATQTGVVYPPVVSRVNTPPVVSAGSPQTIISPEVAEPKIGTSTCASPASSASVADPFITTFSVTVNPGDTVLSVVDGYRAAGKTIASVVFNGSEKLTRSAGTLANTMGAEIWSLQNPTATTANVVITYTAGGILVFDYACARTFTDTGFPIQSGVTTSAEAASSGIRLNGLTSSIDKSVFLDIAACNCGGLIMTAEPKRTLGLNAGPHQVGSSTIITKSPAGDDAMPWTVPAVQATQAGVVYPPRGAGVVANLSGTATDDDLPGRTILTPWSKVSGPGTVVFANAAALQTTATFSASGTYLLRLSATDTALSSSSDVTIVVTPPNTAPVVSAGAAQTITLPGAATLSGTVTDDGLPSGTMLTAWSKVSGPGAVTFANAGALKTTATFSASGDYVLRLTANDTQRSSTSDVTIIVNPSPGAENSLFVMANDLNMQGQTNWFFYNSVDAPEGGYMGWLFQAQTLTGTVKLPRQIPAGRYYVFFYGVSYDIYPTIQAIISGGTSTSVVLNDRDDNRYWADRVVLDVPAASDTLQVLLTRNPAIASDQKYLFRGVYVTDNPSRIITWDGYAINLTYPTVMDDSAPVKGNLVPNGGFEIPIDAGWGFAGQGDSRTVPVNTMWNSGQGHQGQGCLKLTFDSATRVNPNRFKEIVISRVYHLKPNKKYSLSMWMKTSPGLATAASVSLVSTYVPPSGYLPQHAVSSPEVFVTDTWTRLTVTGYALEYPTSDYQIYVRADGPPDNYILIDDVQLEEGDLTDYAPAAPLEAGILIDLDAKPGNVFYMDDVLQADMVSRNNTSSTLTRTLRYEIYDHLNRVVTQGSVPITVPGLSTQRIPFNLSAAGKQGIFRLVTWIDSIDRTEREVVYSVIPRPATTAADPASSLGISPVYTDFQFKFLQRLGFKWARSASPAVLCRWSMVEPSEGQFVWDDAHVGIAGTYGISTMCTIGTNIDWPSWADNGGLPSLAKWQDFVSQVVNHYKYAIKDWEIWNEAYLSFPADFYAQMLKAAADVIEAADPAARIIGCGGTPPAYIQAVIASLQARYPAWDWRQHIDVMSAHNYPEGIAPEKLKPVIDAYNIPIWNTEAGAWDAGFYQGVNSNFVSWGKTAWPHADGIRYYEGAIGAARAVTENYLRTIAAGQTKYFYYDSRYYAGPEYFKRHPTILEYDGTIRAKGIAYAIAGSLIDHSTGLGNASSDPNSFFLVFDKASGPVAALFSGDNQPRQISIGLSSAQFQLLDLMGNLLPNSTTIPYGRFPVYLKGIGITAGTLKAALQAAVIAAAADTTPPNLSISDAPRGPSANHDFRLRWIAVDDLAYPHLGEINPVTNTASVAAPNAIQYSYYLTGYSTAWSSWSAATYVDFSNVPSGSYTFSVVAKDASGNQSAAVSRSIVIN